MSDFLGGAIVAIIGYGNQGEAHAHNLRAHGVQVLVGARPARDADARARADGFETVTPQDAAARASIVALLLPDEAVPAAWPHLAAALKRDVTLVFAHGFNLLYSKLSFPADADVVLVAPTAPGRVLRQSCELGRALPAYLAIHQDGSGNAGSIAERYALGLGCAPLWSTSVREETEVDLFGGQVVLCGGMNALVRAAFETLVRRGYAPEIAYLECVHQLKYLADLLHERGIAGLRNGISGTALFGDLTRGPRVIGEASRAQMESILDEIQSGAFAREWFAEASAGEPRLKAARDEARGDPMEAARKRAIDPETDPGPQ